MLAEYGVIPDVFDASSYTSPEVCDIHLRGLKERLLRDGLVRNLHGGDWQRYVIKHKERWDKRGGELLKKLFCQNRLVDAPAALAPPPVDDVGWCHEALASHRTAELTGVIAGSRTAAEFAGEPCVRAIDRLENVPWAQPSESQRLKRTTGEYLRHLGLVLRHANLLMFIDPHLDPSRPGYREFHKLLCAAYRPGSCQPKVEIHRVGYVGSGQSREVRTEEMIRPAFEELDHQLRGLGMTVDVFVWDDFHDRYLVSNLIGIVMPNGFDVSHKPGEMTTWARLSREDREEVQREFDPQKGAGPHELRYRFSIGCSTR